MSETDDQTPRRPPTIELAATEVEGAAEKAAAGEAGAPASSNASEPGRSGRRLTSHIGSALLGAVLMAAAAVALWFFGAIPSREAAPVTTAASDAPAPPPPALNQPPSSPPTAAQTSPIAPETQRSDPEIGNRIAEVAAQTKALADSLAALTRRVDETAAASQSAGKAADTALIAAQAAKGATDAASKDQVHHEDIDTLANRILALESAVKGLAAATAPLASSGANDRSARLTIAAEALRAAVERGAPYQTELNAVQALGVDRQATAALETFAASGVPSAAALARELEALIPALAEASEPRSGDTTFIERLKSNAQKLVRVTPLNAPPGNEPQAVVDRIRLDAAHAEIAAALADLNALPEAAKPLAAAFSKKAADHEAAVAASKQIAASALAALAQSSAR